LDRELIGVLANRAVEPCVHDRAMLKPTLVWCVLAACGGAEQSAGSGSPQAGAANERCTTDVDCVVAAGSRCNPCGHCPGEAEYATTQLALNAEQGQCSTKAMLNGSMPPPQCSPCPSAPADYVRHTVACKANACVLVPSP
jgi:hypothetical protein